MRILFVNANLYGHINPTLGLVRELSRRGHHIDYFCSQPFKEPVTRNGATWIGYGEALDQFIKTFRPTDRHPFYMLMEYMLMYDEVLIPELLNIIGSQHYDLMIVDSYFGGACFLNRILHLPIVVSHSSFAMSRTPLPERMLVRGYHPQLDACYQIIQRICSQYKVEEPSIEDVFISRGALNVVYTIRAFNNDEGVKPPAYLFNGPSVNRVHDIADIDMTVKGNRKLIYISLGSINTDCINFYRMCMSAFGNTSYYVMMSIGNKCDQSQLGDIPSNFVVQEFLPQLEILEQADVFITHAGFNSVNEALYYGVPMLALPQVNDQKMVAQHLESMNLGITERLDNLSPDILRGKVDALILNEGMKEQCRQMASAMRTSSSLEDTVDAMENYVKEWKRSDYGNEE